MNLEKSMEGLASEKSLDEGFFSRVRDYAESVYYTSKLRVWQFCEMLKKGK